MLEENIKIVNEIAEEEERAKKKDEETKKKAQELQFESEKILEELKANRDKI